MLPATNSGLNHKGQFYLGYKGSNSTVVGSIYPQVTSIHVKLILDSSIQEEQLVSPLIGLISPYYYYHRYLKRE